MHHLSFQDSLCGLVMAPLHVDFFYQEHVVLHHLVSMSLNINMVRYVVGPSLAVCCGGSCDQSINSSHASKKIPIRRQVDRSGVSGDTCYANQRSERCCLLHMTGLRLKAALLALIFSVRCPPTSATNLRCKKRRLDSKYSW